MKYCKKKFHFCSKHSLDSGYLLEPPPIDLCFAPSIEGGNLIDSPHVLSKNKKKITFSHLKIDIDFSQP